MSVREISNAAEIAARIAKGWKPNRYLTNMSMAYFADPKDHVATSIFPICPVDFSTGYYYVFLKGDLARDNVGRKPEFGKVAPAKMGHTDNTYKCGVDQIIVGVDQIGAVNYQRAGVPASIDPRRSKVRFVSEQQLLHLDILFARNYFKTGVWANEFTGISQGTPGATQFLKFNDANFDPVNFFDARKREIKLAGRRMPNKLSLGYDSFNALKNHPDILERVKYTGSSANPAIVNENVLAQILGFEEVKVLEATYNAAAEGQPDNMQFVCEANGALITYTTNSPAIVSLKNSNIYQVSFGRCTHTVRKTSRPERDGSGKESRLRRNLLQEICRGKHKFPEWRYEHEQ